MLKAFHPVAILLISAAFKIQSSCLVLDNDKEAELKAEETAFSIICRLDWTVDRDCAGELLSGAGAGLCLDSDLGDLLWMR
jgi:hypothetical protein